MNEQVMKMVWVTFSVVGYHSYPDAPANVAYLRHTHRHEFKFKVGIEITEENREIEFHTFKRYLLTHLEDISGTVCDAEKKEYDFGYNSCEMIADALAYRIKHSPFGYYTQHDVSVLRSLSVEVSEDGENGAISMHLYKN